MFRSAVKKRKLALYREKKGVTQQGVAKRLGIGLRSYQHYELGEQQGNILVWEALAKFFETSIEELRKPYPFPEL